MREASVSRSQLLLEVHQGSADRAAALSWLSQYDSDRRVALPPMSLLEVRRQYVSGVSGPSGAGELVDGGEVRVLVVDAKVAWSRTASRFFV